MRLVSELLAIKGSKVHTISGNETVYKALKLMAAKNIGALVVVDNGQVVGMFSERDYARKCILENRLSKETHVKEIMSTQVTSVGPDSTVENVMRAMTEKRFRHMPVMEDHNLLGMISIGDVVKEIISNQGVEIEQLEVYIHGLLHA